MMGSVLSIIKRIFKGFMAAANWVNADNARLRQAKARQMDRWRSLITDDNDNPEADAQPGQDISCSPWEEVDSARINLWLGGWYGRRYQERRKKQPEKRMDKAAPLDTGGDE